MGSTKIPRSGYEHILASTLQNILGEAAPARKLELSQLKEALSTGGVGAQIPAIQRMVEATDVGSAQNLQQTKELGARAGLGGTPMDVIAQLNAQQQGSRAASQVGPAAAANIISAFGGMPQSLTSTGIGGLTNLANIDLSRATTNLEATKSFYEDLKSSLESFNPYSGGGGPGGSNTQFGGGGSVISGGSSGGVPMSGGTYGGFLGTSYGGNQALPVQVAPGAPASSSYSSYMSGTGGSYSGL